MRDQRVDLLRTILPQHTSGQPDGVSGIDHIVDQDRNSSFDISDQQFHLLHDIRVVIRVGTQRAGVRASRCGWDSGDDGRGHVPPSFPVDKGKVKVELVC